MDDSIYRATERSFVTIMVKKNYRHWVWTSWTRSSEYVTAGALIGPLCVEDFHSKATIADMSR